MHSFYFLASLLTAIATCPVQAATHGDSVPIVEIFTIREQKARSGSQVEAENPAQGIELNVYKLDGIQQFETVLSKELPTDFNQAKQIALQRLQHLDAKARSALQQTAIGLTKAMQYGLDRYPAIVFDGKAVVLGVTNLESALDYYRQWLSESQ